MSGRFAIALSNLNNIVSVSSENSGSVLVLTLHNVPLGKIVQLKNLIMQLRKNYQFISPVDFTSFINGKLKLKNKNLLLTFDDGFFSNYVAAEKVLNPLGIKAIFFVPTGFIDSESIQDYKSYVNRKIASIFIEPDMKPMSWEQLLQLTNNGHTIGAHTINHFRLSKIDKDDLLREEIVMCGDRIEKQLGVDVQHFAFPFGDINSISKKVLQVANSRYKYVYSGIRGPNKFGINPLAIRREDMNISDSIDYNVVISRGGLSFYCWRARRKLDSLAS